MGKQEYRQFYSRKATIKKKRKTIEMKSDADKLSAHDLSMLRDCISDAHLD